MGAPSLPTAPAPDLDAGYRLGKYEIIKRLAAGGMAEIFLARVTGLPGFQKIVVIKRILPQLANKRDFVEMFLDEARIAATLQHPNVVQVYDVGIVDGNYFMAMEYLHGEDVRSIMKTLFMRQERVPLEQALNIIIGVCSGLHYAHEKVGFDGKPLDIVHRDVTPQNVIVTYEGSIKLLDFGIAKASNRMNETRFGTLKGKVPYMSPEQCRGENPDRRSDIFSLGIMLYELTLGKRLYRGKSDFDVMKQIVEGTITPPRDIDRRYHPRVEQIVMRSLEKERERRFQTVREMQGELEQLVREDHLYVSPMALQKFMEDVFGQKIEAWREAQAQGKSLDQHLITVVGQMDGPGAGDLEDSDLLELDKEEGPAPGHAGAGGERVVTLDAEPGGASDERRADLSDRSESLALPFADAPRRRGPLYALVTLVCLAATGVLLWRVQVHRAGLASQVPPVAIEGTAPAPTTEATKDPPAVVVTTPPVPAVPTVTAVPPVKVVPIAVGILKVRSVPASGATLYLDGRKLEQVTPATLDGIEAEKEHVLLVQLEGYKDVVERVVLKASQVASRDVKLVAAHGSRHSSSSHSRSSSSEKSAKVAAPAAVEKPVKLEGEGTLIVASSPWCNVTIDGDSKGPTPISLKLPAGRHSVGLSNPEFKISRTISVMVLPNETVRKKLDFPQ